MSVSRIALVPAAGSGSRMGGSLPKQYLRLAGRPLIHHALAVLSLSPDVDRVYVVLDAADSQWAKHDWDGLGDKLRVLFCGGSTRGRSVLNGLRAMASDVRRDDWIMVHDAARPCLASWHLDALVRQVGDDEPGGLLAVPLADTLKRADPHGHVAATLDRTGLWLAQTPQMFRHHVLRAALEGCPDVTDEATAIEQLGLRPKLVAADASNLKVTFPVDLQLAEWILRGREQVA